MGAKSQGKHFENILTLNWRTHFHSWVFVSVDAKLCHIFNYFIRLLTLCDYEVPGMILLRDLKGAVRLDRSKDMSVHV